MPNEFIQDLKSRIIETQKRIGKLDHRIRQQNQNIHDLKLELTSLGKENEQLKKLLRARSRSLNKLQSGTLSSNGIKKTPKKLHKPKKKALAAILKQSVQKKMIERPKTTVKPKHLSKKEIEEKNREARKLSSELQKLKGNKVFAPILNAPKTTVKSSKPKKLRKAKA